MLITCDNPIAKRFDAMASGATFTVELLNGDKITLDFLKTDGHLNGYRDQEDLVLKVCDEIVADFKEHAKSCPLCKGVFEF